MEDANSTVILTSSQQKRRVELNGTVSSEDLDVSRWQRLLNDIEARMMHVFDHQVHQLKEIEVAPMQLRSERRSVGSGSERLREVQRQEAKRKKDITWKTSLQPYAPL